MSNSRLRAIRNFDQKRGRDQARNARECEMFAIGRVRHRALDVEELERRKEDGGEATVFEKTSEKESRMIVRCRFGARFHVMLLLLI